jgi:hypothetical protein
VFDIEKKDIDNVNSDLAKLMMISFVFVLLPSVHHIQAWYSHKRKHALKIKPLCCSFSGFTCGHDGHVITV